MELRILFQIFIIWQIYSSMIQGDDNIDWKTDLLELLEKENAISKYSTTINKFPELPTKPRMAKHKRHRRRGRKKKEVTTDNSYLIETSTTPWEPEPTLLFNVKRFVEKLRDGLLNENRINLTFEDLAALKRISILNSTFDKLIKSAFSTNSQTPKLSENNESNKRTRNNSFERKKCKYKATSTAESLDMKYSTVSGSSATPSSGMKEYLRPNGRKTENYIHRYSSLELNKDFKGKSAKQSEKATDQKRKKCKNKKNSTEVDDENNGETKIMKKNNDGKEMRLIMSTHDLLQNETDQNTNTLLNADTENKIKLITEEAGNVLTKAAPITANETSRLSKNFKSSEGKFENSVAEVKPMPLQHNNNTHILNVYPFIKNTYQKKDEKAKPSVANNTQPKRKNDTIFLTISLNNNQANDSELDDDDWDNMPVDVGYERRYQLGGSWGADDDLEVGRNLKDRGNNPGYDISIAINSKEKISSKRKKCKKPKYQQISINVPEAPNSHHYDEFDLLFNKTKLNARYLKPKYKAESKDIQEDDTMR